MVGCMRCTWKLPASRVIAIVMLCALVLPILARYRPQVKGAPIPKVRRAA